MSTHASGRGSCPRARCDTTRACAPCAPRATASAASSCGGWTPPSTSAGCRKRAAVLVALLIAALPAALRGQERWSLTIFGGSAWSVPSRLEIDQSGEETISLDAHWETRPFEDAPYYAVRVALASGARAWELQLLHHKLYLANPTAEIQHFEVSHGENLITIAHAWRRGLDWRVGAGAVVTHVEGRVRGEDVGSDYHLSGAAAIAGAGKRFRLSRTFFAELQGDLTFSYADIPIRNGRARVGNAAVHALVGLGLTP